MGKEPDTPAPPGESADRPPPEAEKGPDGREARRAAALRANLRRRKAADTPGEAGP